MACGVPFCLLRRIPDDRELRCVLLGRGHRERIPAICVLSGQSQHTGPLPSDPDIRGLAYRRPQVHHGVIQQVVLATKVKGPLVREASPDDLQGLLQPTDRL